MPNCSQCSGSTSTTGCGCGSTGCTVNITDQCMTLKTAIDLGGGTVLPAGTDYETVIAAIAAKLNP